jgi:transcriptional regulator with XRE-family HTH domain
LGPFLQSRRARLAPAADAAVARRRRTAGLTREEVAAAAGISTTWYTWLEQGRDIRVSPQALTRIADALKLDDGERSYLFRLAEQVIPRPFELDTVDGKPERVRLLAENLLAFRDTDY